MCWGVCDFGIFSIPGVTEILWEFMYRAQNERVISIPGCWSRNYKYDDEWPCWRLWWRVGGAV